MLVHEPEHRQLQRQITPSINRPHDVGVVLGELLMIRPSDQEANIPPFELLDDLGDRDDLQRIHAGVPALSSIIRFKALSFSRSAPARSLAVCAPACNICNIAAACCALARLARMASTASSDRVTPGSTPRRSATT